MAELAGPGGAAERLEIPPCGAAEALAAANELLARRGGWRLTGLTRGD